MEVIHTRCAGIDISKKDAKVCVRVQGSGSRATASTVTTWGSMTGQILELKEHLLAEHVSLVVMEATGDYWRPFYYVFEEELNVILVNAHDAKNVPGRKTDVSDSAWLADLGAHGLVKASFVPPPPIRELRDLTRARTVITRERSREIQRLEKLLEDAGIKLSSVATDITGVSARAMLQALIEGQNDPAVLADLAVRSLRSKIPQLTQALTGRFSDHHRFMTALFLHRIDAHSADIGLLGEQIDEVMEPFRAAGELLVSIPGFSNRIAEVFVAETGADMSVFPTAAHLASWAGAAPGSNESAGRVKSTKTRPGNCSQRSTRHRSPIGHQVEGHLPVSQIQTHRVAAGPDESPRRCRARHGRRRLAHAHHRRVLPRPRSGLLHPADPDKDQNPGDQPTRIPRLPRHHRTIQRSRMTADHPSITTTLRAQSPRVVNSIFVTGEPIFVPPGGAQIRATPKQKRVKPLKIQGFHSLQFCVRGGTRTGWIHAQDRQFWPTEREIGFRWVPLLTVAPCDVPPGGAPILKLYSPS